MGLDTRAFHKSTDEWKKEWVERANAEGGRPIIFGMFWEPIGNKNYGLAGGYLDGRPPFTVEDAPTYHQEGLHDLPWPGGQKNYGLAGGRVGPPYPLVSGMISGYGNGPSFRGKAYGSYVQLVTGRSLYDCIDEPWEGEQLRAITMLLENAAADGPDGYTSQEERQALAQWFRVCVDNDLAVSGDA